MTMPQHLQQHVLAAWDQLQRSTKVDPDLVVSELGDDGHVQVEGTVPLADLVAAVLASAGK